MFSKKTTKKFSLEKQQKIHEREHEIHELLTKITTATSMLAGNTRV